MRNGVSLAPALGDRPPRAPPVITVILHNNGRDGDAQVLLRARGARGHLVDPVGSVEKLKEEADSGVHQRHTWTKRSFRRTLATLGPKFEFLRQAVAIHLAVSLNLRSIVIPN